MYQCLICMDVLEGEGYCNCGRTYVDKKHRAKGELFIFLGDRDMNGMSRVDRCPHCGWRGLVVPRMGIGCPEHGMWWYKKEDKNIPSEEDQDETKQPERKRQRRRNKRINRESKRTENKKRKRLLEHVRPRQGKLCKR